MAVNFFSSSNSSQTSLLELENSLQQKTALGRYVAYSPEAFEAAKDKKRIYYFHAVWCPTCKVVNEEFTSQEDKIPADVTIFKTDYDSQTELKNQFADSSHCVFGFFLTDYLLQKNKVEMMLMRAWLRFGLIDSTKSFDFPLWVNTNSRLSF